jgi:hypothetical protein
MALPWTVEHTSRNVLTVRLEITGRSGWEQCFLLRSDAHHDNPHCDLAMERKHLDRCVDMGAGALDFGDAFCAMQGRYDKRSDKSALRPEHKEGNYLDRLVETQADDYGPYAKHWLLRGIGNHETSIRTRHETDLTERVVSLMNTRHDAQTAIGGYTGWVRFLFRRGQEKLSRVLWYTHGYGGGGAVTEDKIQANRQAVYVENADIMCSGHTHDAWQAQGVRLKMSQSGRIERRTYSYVKTGCYKDEYGDGAAGWCIEKGHKPKPLGAHWLRFFYDGDALKHEITFLS